MEVTKEYPSRLHGITKIVERQEYVLVKAGTVLDANASAAAITRYFPHITEDGEGNLTVACGAAAPTDVTFPSRFAVRITNCAMQPSATGTACRAQIWQGTDYVNVRAVTTGWSLYDTRFIEFWLNGADTCRELRFVYTHGTGASLDISVHYELYEIRNKVEEVIVPVD